MKTLLKSVMVASLMLGGATVQPALAAESNSGTIVHGIAFANIDAVIQNSSAFQTAEQQRPVTYKAQFDAAEQRRNQLQAQLKPLVDKFEADRQVAKADQQALAREAQQIQQLQQSGQQELQQLMMPVSLSNAYVLEQINDKIDAAVKNAMKKKNVSLLLGQEVVLASNQAVYNLNPDILTELNALLPTAQLVPPQGWEPRQIREAKAAQAAQQQAATAGPQAQGR